MITIERQGLVDALKNVEPALAKNDVVHEFTHVWFNKGCLRAGNSQGLAIQTDFKSDFEGGLPGLSLLGLVNNSASKTVSLEQKGEEILVTLGGCKAHLPYLKENGLLSNLERVEGVPLTEEIEAAFKAVIPFVGRASSNKVEERGVTVYRAADSVEIFSTDDSTVTRVLQPWPGIKPGKRLVLSKEFVEQVIALCKSSLAEARINLDTKTVTVSDKSIVVCSKPWTTENPVDMQAIYARNMEGQKPFKIPQRLRLALARSFVMLDGEKEPHCVLNIANKVLRITTETKHGLLKDAIPLEADVPAIEVQVNPVYLKRVLTVCTKMAISKNCVVMYGKGFRHFIAPFG
jgi:DNA polymerase III sliding clamp (beta) subunit (PCNA family)